MAISWLIQKNKKKRNVAELPRFESPELKISQRQPWEIGKLLEEKNEGHRITNISEESLSSLANFFNPFKQAIV